MCVRLCKKIFFISLTFSSVIVTRGQFFECHSDSSFDPEEGPLEEIEFSWIATLQYISVKRGTPHYFRVPRVVLISRQFVLSTAADAAEVPDGYALGNVVFGDYERDEEECNLKPEEIAAGAECKPAIMLMPIADVLLHPEYKHFGAKNSIALMKLLKTVSSQYVVPVCLPFKNFIMKRGRQTTEKLYHIDYPNDVPRDFVTEEKEVQKLSLLPRELCYLYDEQPENSTNFVKNRMACSTGCGLHSGAPSLVHEKTGHWSIVAIATGGASCPDPLRPRRPPTPPRHILIHPYVPWITAAIAGKAMGAFAKDDPFGFMMPRAASPHDLPMFHTWVGHWWMGGPRCNDRGDAADDLMRFYHEIFQVQPGTHTVMDYYLEIDAAIGTLIVCVKVGMPYRLGRPRVWELDTPVVRVKIPVIPFSNTYRMQVEGWAYNTTESSDSGDEDENECESAASDECSN